MAITNLKVSNFKSFKDLDLILRRLLADPEKSRNFHNLLHDLLPFAVEIGTEQYLGTSLILQLREKYYEDTLLANLLLLSRDEAGFSTICRPAEKEAVKIFLAHDLGLDDLFVQDVLAVP